MPSLQNLNLTPQQKNTPRFSRSTACCQYLSYVVVALPHIYIFFNWEPQRHCCLLNSYFGVNKIATNSQKKKKAAQRSKSQKCTYIKYCTSKYISSPNDNNKQTEGQQNSYYYSCYDTTWSTVANERTSKQKRPPIIITNELPGRVGPVNHPEACLRNTRNRKKKQQQQQQPTNDETGIVTHSPIYNNSS